MTFDGHSVQHTFRFKAFKVGGGREQEAGAGAPMLWVLTQILQPLWH